MIAAVVSALRHLTLEDIRPEDVFELTMEESGPWRRERRSRNAADVDAWRRERDAAVRLLRELAQIPSDDWLSKLLTEGPSDATVRALIFEGRDVIDTKPDRAERLFSVAAQLAEQLPLRHEYRMALTGRAWLELANALRQLGRFADALPALDEAARRFEGEPYCTKELGRAWLTRGTVLLKSGDLDQAERYLRRAVNVFAAVDDHRRIAKVRMVQAGILFERSDFAAARDLWLSAAPALEAGRERHALAVTWLNVGICEIERGDATAARRWLEKALAAFVRLRCEVEVIRTRWHLARRQALYEDRTSGVRSLVSIRDEFEQRKLFTDAGMVSLHIAEALLLPPRRAAAAAKVCAALPALFSQAGATREMLKAVAYLREAADRLRREDVKYVLSFLERGERGESFIPPGERR
jgi:tetratricopeptide (TPR) repeat protein